MANRAKCKTKLPMARNNVYRPSLARNDGVKNRSAENFVGIGFGVGHL